MQQSEGWYVIDGDDRHTLKICTLKAASYEDAIKKFGKKFPNHIWCINVDKLDESTAIDYGVKFDTSGEQTLTEDV